MSTYRPIRTVHHVIRDCELRTARIEHQVVEVLDAGPCRESVKVRVGEVLTLVPCGRRLPVTEQCDACKPRIELVDVRRIIHSNQASAAGLSWAA